MYSRPSQPGLTSGPLDPDSSGLTTKPLHLSQNDKLLRLCSKHLTIGFEPFKPNQGHCVVFVGKAPCSHSASLHPGV